jgi:hypothetical protein
MIKSNLFIFILNNLFTSKKSYSFTKGNILYDKEKKISQKQSSEKIDLIINSVKNE